MASERRQTNSGRRSETATRYVDGFVIAVPRNRIDEYEADRARRRCRQEMNRRKTP